MKTDHPVSDVQDDAAKLEADRLHNERLAIAVDVAQLGVWENNFVTGEVVFDDRMYSFYEYTREEGVHPTEIYENSIHPDDLHKPNVEADSAPIDQNVIDTEFRLVTRSGKVKNIRSMATMFRDEDRNIVRVVGTNWDVTNLRQLEASLKLSEARTRSVIDNASQAIIMVDNAGLITSWNRHAEVIFGWTADEAIGQPIVDLIIAPGERAAHRKTMAPFLLNGEGAGADPQTEWQGLRKNGQDFPIEMSVSAIKGPDGWELTQIIQDISERRAQTQLFENAFNYAPIGMIVVSIKGECLKVNNAFCDIVRYTREEILSNCFIVGDVDETDIELNTQMVKGEIPSYQREKRYACGDGGHVWVSVTVSLVSDAHGKPLHFIAQVQDLTARRAAELALQESEARLRLMADNMTDMIVATDATGAITFITPSCFAITGYEPQDMIGTQPNHAHPDDRARLDALFEDLRTGKPGRRVRWRIRHKTEDRWVWLESNPSLLGGGDQGFFLDVMRDVTAQVAQDEALARAMAEAEAATSAKGEFLANMSHEIRTPLTAVVGFTGLLAERKDLDESAQSHVQRISSAGRALLAIVNDILDFSKLEAGQYEMMPRAASPADVTQDACLMFSPQSKAKGLSLDMVVEGEVPAYCSFDPDRLRQVLLNLIGNAAKFTDAGGVTVRMRYDYDLSQLHLSVDDTGAGLTEAQRSKLFQRFSQVDTSSTRRHGGTGLGLAICKGLTEAMGGEIAVSSTLGVGSSFYFHINAPIAEAPADAGQSPIENADVSGVQILVVDDNPTNRELARLILQQIGVEVAEAEDGESAIKAAAETPYDVILMDIRMPGMGGIEAMRMIRSQPGANQNTPILAFSADADLETLSRNEGFNGIVKKPLAPMELINSIARLVDGDDEAGDAEAPEAQSA